MRVLFITQYYPPEIGAAPLRASNFASRLTGMGHEVTVLTGMPNHPSGIVRGKYRGKLRYVEDVEGVRVVRVQVYASPRKTFLRRMLNHISFTATSFLAGLTAGRADVILVSSPPLFLGISAWLLSLIRAAPFVLDIRDYWPHAAVELGQLRGRRLISLAEGLERFLYRRAARLVAVTPGMERMMLERGIPGHRIALIPNGADLDRFSPAPDDSTSGNGTWTAIYGGTHGLVHGMEVILEAADLLRDDERVRFVLVGDGVAKDLLVEEARRRALRNVEFLPSVPPEELAALIRASDVCLATTRPGAFSGGTIPVKLFDYMACGRPVVAAVSGDARDLVERSGGGVSVDPGDAPALAHALVDMLEHPERARECGEKGNRYVCVEYSRERLAERLAEVLTSVLAAERVLDRGHFGVRRYLAGKYALDVVFAALFLVVTSPLFLLLSILIKLDSPGPAIFRQRRIGVYSEEFLIWKFRTMYSGTPDLATDVMAGRHRSYTTRLGRFLRRTSLDELPNFWNILRGEMSVVGPRPALYNQSELIERRRQLGVDLLRPGLTGWAQINGRDSVKLDEKVRLDEFYVRNCSLPLDAKILLRTAGAMSSQDQSAASAARVRGADR
ncbi:MAG: glycosyltransferase [Candidatus Eisenbacteria bacterium]|nr:glycosyltransferase [Candidatus Eisenbacteria bacterium]